MRNKFIVITGPSGSGKTTTLSNLINTYPNRFDVHKSYTTRNPRDIEDYKYYHFSTMDEFFDKIRLNEFIEWEEIYSDSYYGTPKAGLLNSEKVKVLVKDVKGAKFLKRLYGKDCVLIYLKTEDIEAYKERISKDTDRDKLKERFARIEYENSFQDLNADKTIDTVKYNPPEVVKIINNLFYIY